jgi:haloalkane dehalogenase
MWEPLMDALAESGRAAYAPDLYALGDSTDFGPATFENSRERFAQWMDEIGDEQAVLVVHDWGGFIGLSWACDHPDRVEALVISDTGFFADGKPIFSEDEIDAYWAPFEDGRGRQATLDFYRSMDFEKLEPWQGKLGELGVPTLLLWGADDPFAPLAGAHRFEREIPGAQLVAIEGAGHFVFDEARERCTTEVLRFVSTLGA